MVIAFTNGSKLMDGTEQTLVLQTGSGTYSTKIFLDPLQLGDTIVIKVYGYDQVAGAFKIYKEDTLSGPAPTEVEWNYAPISEYQYKVTIQQTAGTNRTFNWVSVSF